MNYVKSRLEFRGHFCILTGVTKHRCTVCAALHNIYVVFLFKLQTFGSYASDSHYYSFETEGDTEKVKESEMMDVGESKLDDEATAAGNTEDSSEGFFYVFL